MFIKFGAVLFAFAAFGLEAANAQQVVVWSNMSASGNGCPSGSAVVTATPDGNELSWTAENFGFDLSGPAATARFCRLSASAQLSPGYYLERLRQEVSYGGKKSTTGSSFSVGVQGRFFGYNLRPIRRDYPSGTSFDRPKLTLYSNQTFTNFAPASFFCAESNTAGLFQGTVSVNGQVLEEKAFVSLGIQGQTVSYKAIFRWAACSA